MKGAPHSAATVSAPPPSGSSPGRQAVAAVRSSASPPAPQTQQDDKGKLLHIFHADSNNQVALICPACKTKRMLDGDKLRTVKQPATMKCKCGNVFQCRFQLVPLGETPAEQAAAMAAALPSADPDELPRNALPADATDAAEMNMPVFTADRNNRFTVICPNCQDARTLDGDKVKAVKQPATMKCKCGVVFKCRFKFFEPDFPAEPERLETDPDEALDLPEFTNISETKRFSEEVKNAAFANRQALMTFRNVFETDFFSEEEDETVPADPDAVLRDAPPRDAEDVAPFTADAVENIDFGTPSPFPKEPATLPESPPSPAELPPPDAGALMPAPAPVPATINTPAPAMVPSRRDPRDEAEHKRALAVLRLANLEKKRAREAMEQAESERQRVLAEIQMAAQEHQTAVTSDQQDLERRRAETLYHQAYLEKQRAQAALQHAEVKRLEAEVDTQRRQFDRERQELSVMRTMLEQERQSIHQQKLELERLLRMAPSMAGKQPGDNAAPPAHLPIFTPDAEGQLHVVCPNCSQEKVVPATAVAGVKQPTRMKCHACKTVFHCGFNLSGSPSPAPDASLQPPTAAMVDDIPTFFPDLDGQVTIICPECQSGRTVSKDVLRVVKQPAQVKCSSCGHSFLCRFELGTTPSIARDLTQPHAPQQTPPPAADAPAPGMGMPSPADDTIPDEDITLEPVETMVGLDEADVSAMSMHSDELGNFVQKLYHPPGSPTAPASTSPSLDEAELNQTISPERLDALFDERDEEDIAAAAVSLMGDQLSEYVQQMDKGAEETTSNAGEASEPFEAEVLEVSPEELMVEVLPDAPEVLPALPFESAHDGGHELPIYYVDEKKQVMVVCPKCERGRNLDFSSHPSVGPVIRTWCKCGNEFLCRLEFRRTYRKRVELTGQYFNPTTGQRGDVLVIDLSLGGVGFTTKAPHHLKRDVIIDLSFQLDNLKMTRIHRRVRVCNIKDRFVGSEFLEQRERDKELGYYLMP